MFGVRSQDEGKGEVDPLPKEEGRAKTQGRESHPGAFGGKKGALSRRASTVWHGDALHSQDTPAENLEVPSKGRRVASPRPVSLHTQLMWAHESKVAFCSGIHATHRQSRWHPSHVRGDLEGTPATLMLAWCLLPVSMLHSMICILYI